MSRQRDSVPLLAFARRIPRRPEMVLTCLVEIPRGSRNKYEYDEEREIIRLDRRLFSSVVYPCDYGFLEQTLTAEGRHLDALVLVNEPTFPACRVDIRPIGLFRMRDETGIDDKVPCVPLHDPEWAATRRARRRLAAAARGDRPLLLDLQRPRTRSASPRSRMGRSRRSRAWDRGRTNALATIAPQLTRNRTCLRRGPGLASSS